MSEIIKVYKQKLPKCRFIGKKYYDEDRVDGNFGAKWNEWFEKGHFAKLESLLTDDFRESCEDIDAYVGLMRNEKGEPFEYWIGMFLPADTVVEQEFEYVDFPEINIGVCYVKGLGWDIYCMEEECMSKLKENGHKIIKEDQGALWFFERYACPRFTTPDEQGNVILDICYFIL